MGGLPLLQRSISRGGFRGLPRRRQSNSHARRRRPCRAQWPGRTQLRRGVRVSPPTTASQLARTPKKAMPSAAARPSAAEKGVRGSPPTTAMQLAHTPKKAKPSAAARLSAAGKRSLGFPPTTAIQLARTPKKARPSAAASPSAAEKGVRVIFRLHHNTTRRRAEVGQAQRPGQAQRRRGLGGSPATTAIQLARTHRRRPSRAHRPGRAPRRRGVQGLPPAAAIQLACTPK